jgi:hypothetical protein
MTPNHAVVSPPQRIEPQVRPRLLKEETVTFSA